MTNMLKQEEKRAQYID